MQKKAFAQFQNCDLLESFDIFLFLVADTFPLRDILRNSGNIYNSTFLISLVLSETIPGFWELMLLCQSETVHV